jgi:lysophospholipase L1-like esterase
MRMDRLSVSMLVAMLVCAVSACRAEDIPVKSGEKIAFLGDSITAGGVSSPSGYVRLVISGLEANGIKAEMIPAGVSGHKSNDMLARVDKDVIAKKPNWMTLSCGVNDVWHGDHGVALDKYKTNIAEIVSKAQAVGIKVMILTSTLIGEEVGNPNNVKAIPYNDYLRELAKEKKCLLADLNTEMRDALKANPNPNPKGGNVLTGDGVHMNPLGDQMMATGILKAFGLNDEQLKKAHEFWLDIPHAVNLQTKASLSLRQFNQLHELAAKQNRNVNDLIGDELNKSVEALLKAGK